MNLKLFHLKFKVEILDKTMLQACIAVKFDIVDERLGHHNVQYIVRSVKIFLKCILNTTENFFKKNYLKYNLNEFFFKLFD